MNIERLKESNIKDILVYNGKGVNGFKMMLILDNGKILYFNSLWMHYFDEEDFKSDYNFERLDINYGSIENIYCFEGVGFYIMLSTGYIIHLYEEVFDFKEPNYKYTFKIVSNKNKEIYNEILNDIIEMEESDDIFYTPPKFW
ncbi:hypothetical protein [Tenacibaculum aiptasiae]|uniref:hypothetical protein n=1 Tax=Tenacibaculum aiptasiae TaxID=426481 RepID=UPI003B58B96D